MKGAIAMNSKCLATSGALALALSSFAAGSALAEISYTYAELDYVNIDADISETMVDDEMSTRLATNDDDGFKLGGAWQFYGNWHLFGEYMAGQNDIDLNADLLGEEFRSSGDFDITRYRAGVGYGHPVSEDLSLYGRISYDYIEFDNVDIDGLDDNDIGNTDDSGLGAEGGVRWMVANPFEVNGYARYTAVGKVDTDRDDKFDDDLLLGVNGCYFFNDMFGVEAGYEYGEMSTWSLGARLQF